MSEPMQLKMPFSFEQFLNFMRCHLRFSYALIDSRQRLVAYDDDFSSQFSLHTSMHPLDAVQVEVVSHGPEFDGQWQESRMKIAGQDQVTRCSRLPVESDKGEQLQLLLFTDGPPHMHLNLLQQFAGAFMHDVNLGVMLINMNFELIDISDMACRIIGLPRERMINRSLDEVFTSVPQQHLLVQRNLLDGVVVRNHAVSWTNDQERYELLMDSNLLVNHYGQPVGAYVIFKDVSNLRSLEEQVQRSDRLAMIGQIAAGTAHEIRNPLTSIKGFLQVLRKSLAEHGMEKECSYTEIMLTEINRINGLVSEFLLLSKPRDSVYHRVDISMVLNEILPIINSEAILHNVSVEYERGDDVPLVIADREMLKQVYLNICKNGIEAMGEAGGSLVIRETLETEMQRVNVDIIDTGPGIPSFLIDKIFDPFFTTKAEGIGLGLSVCQRIIHDMGGSIRVKSKGFGTTFTISIPCISA